MFSSGAGMHVGLVAQRALAERQPDRDVVLLLAGHAHVPARLVVVLAAVDRLDHRVVGGERRRASAVDLRLRVGRATSCVVQVAHRVGSRAGHQLAHGEVGVDPPQARRGEAPTCSCRARRRRAGPDAAPRAPGRRGSAPMYRANADGSRSGTRKPLSPSSTSVSRPPTPLATTGMPHADASSATSPKLSLRLGTTTTSAAR